MTPTARLWLWIAFTGMTIGTLIFGFKSVQTRRREGMEFHLESFFITLWAATLYLTMALGETVTEVRGETVFWGRYVDWLVTTPLLLLELGVVAGLRPKLLAGVLGADIFMILTGLLANLESLPTAYLWYTISTGAFVAIALSLFTEFAASADLRSPRINQLFKKLRNILITLWVAYPIIWILGAEGIEFIPTGIEVALYAIVDLCAKVGFGLVLSSADSQVLAEASNPKNIGETAQSYLQSRSH